MALDFGRTAVNVFLTFYFWLRGGGGDLHASQHGMRADYIINSRPPTIGSFDNRRREGRKSTCEWPAEIFFIRLPAVFLFFSVQFVLSPKRAHKVS